MLFSVWCTSNSDHLECVACRAHHILLTNYRGQWTAKRAECEGRATTTNVHEIISAEELMNGGASPAHATNSGPWRASGALKAPHFIHQHGRLKATPNKGLALNLQSIMGHCHASINSQPLLHWHLRVQRKGLSIT